MTAKPIRVFWSRLTGRFYATRSYKEISPGVVEVSGERFDVTDDILAILEKEGWRREPVTDLQPLPPDPKSASGDGGL